MHLSKVIWARFKWQCPLLIVYNRLYYTTSSSRIPYTVFSCYNKLNNNASSYVKDVSLSLAYSTNSKISKNDTSEKEELTKLKKKKEVKTYITLLGTDGNIISVTTVEEASKLASRRNLRLVKAMDIDPKTGRAVFKLMTESEYLKEDTDWGESKSKKGKEKTIKGDKVVSLSSNTAEHDIQTKVKMMQKWLEKRLEVRVVITGDLKNGDNVFKIIETNIGTTGRIIQKRTKGQDIRFQILPPKRTEVKQTEKEET